MVEIVPRVSEWLLSERRIQKDNPSQVPCQVPLMLEGALATARQGVPTRRPGAMCGRRVECPQAQHHNCGASVSTSSSSAVRDDVTEARGGEAQAGA